MVELSTTSHAILGLLAIKPWTTYELAQQMDRALGLFWPRARSHLYAEPKKLVTAGLAVASVEATGNRNRTVYSITEEGRRALERWVSTPGIGPVIEFGALVNVFFAEFGTKDDLLATLDAVRGWVESHAAQGAGIPNAYLEGGGQFPERLPWLVLVGKFLDDYEQMLDNWAAWAMATVASWPEEMVDAEPNWDALRRMAQHTTRLSRRAATRRPDASADAPRDKRSDKRDDGQLRR